MLKCLMKYEWVKLRRDTLPVGKGIMGAWSKLAARAAWPIMSCVHCAAQRTIILTSFMNTVLHTDLNRSPNEGLIRVPDRHTLFPYLVESNKNARIKSIAL